LSSSTGEVDGTDAVVVIGTVGAGIVDVSATLLPDDDGARYGNRYISHAGQSIMSPCELRTVLSTRFSGHGPSCLPSHLGIFPVNSLTYNSFDTREHQLAM